MAVFPHISGMEKITVNALAERSEGDPRPVQRVLLASLIAGLLWDSYGPDTTFATGAAFAALAMAGLLLIGRRK